MNDKPKPKVAFATGSRADYGIVRNYIALLNTDPLIDFHILATGALVGARYGHALSIVEDDGFVVDDICRIPLEVASTADTAHTMAHLLDYYARYFRKSAYDLLIVLGDRYEIYMLALAAALYRIPLLHLHGGEQTQANYDEFIRHAITKMSTFHITSTEAYRRRVVQLGEPPERVYCLGALGAENCLTIDLRHVPEELRTLKNYFCVLYHPETLNAQPPARQIEEVLEALRPFARRHTLVFLGCNADTHSDQITRHVKSFCEKHPQHCRYYVNLHPEAYHYLVKHAIALVGNSSSGLIEAPSLGTYTVNIGDRQKGRVRGASVLDTPCRREDIGRALRYAIEHQAEPITDTPYYRPDTANNYYRATRKMLDELPGLTYKVFYDIE